MKHVALMLLCLAFTPAQAGELFRWVDANGKVHYSDTPPADTAVVERKKFANDVSQSEDLPYETQRAKQNFPVTLYVGEGCGGPCDIARTLLTKRGIPFSEKLLKFKDDIEAFKKLSGFEDVPALSVGKSFLRGFLAEQWNSELDVAGYPKTASYRQRNAPPKHATPENKTPPAEPAAK